MRKLTDCERPAQASSLVAELRAEGIDSQVRGEAPWEVWVLDHDEIPAALAFLEQRSRGEPRPTARETPEPNQSKPKPAPIAARPSVDLTARWKERSIPGLPAITIVLAVAAVMVAYETNLGDPTVMTVQNLSIEPWRSGAPFEQILAGQVWRLFTPVLIHFGLFHLLFNLMWVARFGAQIERLHGPATMALVVGLSAVVGNVVQYLVTGPSFGGLSGVVYALFGFVWMQVRYDGRPGYALDPRDVVLMMVWFVACATVIPMPIANAAHAAGLIVGLGLGMPLYLRQLRQRRGEPRFVPGSWEDVHVKGWKRLARRVLTPYAPLWMLALAAVVMALE